MKDDKVSSSSAKIRAKPSNITNAVKDSLEKRRWRLPIFRRSKASDITGALKDSLETRTWRPVTLSKKKGVVSKKVPNKKDSKKRSVSSIKPVKKKSKLWIWLVAVIVLVGIAIWSYFIFFGSVYPSSISGFPRLHIYNASALKYSECFDLLNDGEDDTCISGLSSVTYGNEAEMNDVALMKVTKGSSTHKMDLRFSCNEPLFTCENNVVVDGKTYENQKMIYWYYAADEFVEVKQWGSDMKVLESSVVKHFMKKFPPIVF